MTLNVNLNSWNLSLTLTLKFEGPKIEAQILFRPKAISQCWSPKGQTLKA
jgi:hypothetical protein